MMNRRNFFGASASAGAAAGINSFFNASAEAAEVKAPQGTVAVRGADGRLKRLGTLDLESQQDFTLGFRLMHNKKLRAQSQSAFERLLYTKKVDPATQMTMEEMLALVADEPAIHFASKTWLANQQVTWKTLQDYFHANADLYLSEMDAADKVGPGKLELSPTMDIPAECRHEIHIQPGGYVGDEFAGHIYHYGTNSFYIAVLGHNEQDQIHKGVAARLPIPEDGKVKRILDMGCGVGQYTVALKERFPEAEVWGIDIGGPMVRYAHTRANFLNNGANFAQRLAYDTKFPDGYFDLVTSYIMHHEVPAEGTKKIIDEARRVTRTGGVYYPLDFMSGGTKAVAPAMYNRWWDHRWNNEVWSREYHSIDFSKEIAARGFTMPAKPVAALPGFGARHAIKV